MPASDDELHDAFSELVGTDSEEQVYANAGVAGDWEEWAVLFSETGIDFEDSAETVEAFRDFLIAFYPQEGVSGDDWQLLRWEYYEMYGIDEHNIDWQAWREAIGY